MWQDTFRIGVERPSRVRKRATYIRRTVATGMEKRRDICVRDETRSASYPAVILAFYESTARAAAARFFLYFPPLQLRGGVYSTFYTVLCLLFTPSSYFRFCIRMCFMLSCVYAHALYHRCLFTSTDE